VSYLMMVDQIADLDAKMAALKADREALAGELKTAGAGQYEGSLHIATVSESERTTVDWRTVAEKMEPSRQLIAAHSETRVVVSLRLTGKARKAAAA